MTQADNGWVAPSSFAQERIWIANQLDLNSPVYNVSSPTFFAAGITGEHIIASLSAIVARHESMRTHLRVQEGALVQVVSDPQPLDLPELDLRHASMEDSSRIISELAETLAREAIALDRPPLWRAKLIRRTEERWVLLFVAHHAIFDSQSHVIFQHELKTLTEAAAAGTVAPLAELPIQYADFAAWQRETLTGEEHRKQLAYWTQRLADAPPVLGLPYDRPRDKDTGFAGAEVHFPMPADLLDRATEVGKAAGATPFMVFLSAYAVLLSRLCSTGDVVIGVSSGGRDRAEVAPLIGMFVNPVVVRAAISGEQSFNDVLAQVRAELLDALEHGETPFQHVVEAVVPARDPLAPPIFQAAFNFIPDSGIDHIQLGTTKDDLAMDIAPGTSRLLYRTALFDASTAEAIAARYLRLLTAAVTEPGQRISDLPLLSDSEHALVTQTFNDTAHDTSTVTVVEMLESQALQTPHAVAVMHAGQQLTYAELHARANRLARGLISRGVGPERLVALALPLSLDLVIAAVAVLKAGGSYLPVDLSSPLSRRLSLIDDAGATLTLDSLDFADGDDAPVTDADRLAPLQVRHPAYVIYTSGSTGRPKGVVVEHASAHAYLDWARQAYPGLAGVAHLHSPLTFDLTVTGFLGPLTTGGAVRLAALDEASTPPSFLKATPGQVPLLDAKNSPTNDLVLGGEALTAEALQAWRSAHPNATVVNEYGPTEATVGCIVEVIPPGQDLPAGAVPIGRPIWNMRAYLLDEALTPVPPGVAGELYLAGPQLARGYLNRPGLTAERFLPCPFGEPGQRMYRTGDLARHRADGTIEYLGRADRQLKVSGIRVEPGEIESVLLAQPGVSEAVVIARPGPDGDNDLIAYIVGNEVAAETLAQLIPAYMVPKAIVTVDAIPLTRNGKVDRDKLPAPTVETTVSAPAYVAPATDTQALVAEVFAAILQVDRVSALDDFFALGGNSLRGMRAMAKLRAAVDVDLPVRTLFAHPVVQDLATEIERLITAELDQLSDDEVAALLDAETGQSA